MYYADNSSVEQMLNRVNSCFWRQLAGVSPLPLQKSNITPPVGTAFEMGGPRAYNMLRRE
ncbi:unnamed protein product [Ectocarpus sp. CCAP 1310/34]|nr:unnamed protein product [Ectocarpus sp. CCAP 1310/34]